MFKIIPFFVILFLFALTAIAQPQQTSIKFQNKTRTFIIYLPQNYQPEENLPLVINMHPFVGTASGQMSYTKYNRLADTARCIVVYPNGIGGRWNSGTFFGISSNVDDVGFIGRLIDYMTLFYRIDTKRVYATGYSAGGFMSYKLACELTNRIAAIAPVAASMVPEGNFDNCVPSRTFPVLAINSVNDPVTIYNGFVSVTPIDQVIALWQQINGCDVSPLVELVPNIVQNDGSTVERITYQNCENSELIFLKQFGAGHTWPGASNASILGNTNMDINANHESWNFFKRHSIPDELACAEPENLNFNYNNGIASLTWNAIPNVDFYTVFGQWPNGEIFYLENITSNSIEIAVAQEGILKWAVSAQCVSGHVNWSEINENTITARLAADLTIQVYPNPTSHQINVLVPNQFNNTQYYILDVFGSIKMSGQFNANQQRITVETLPTGWYTLRTNDGLGKVNFYKN
jgi:polyhydroxybutyrate depolymerase